MVGKGNRANPGNQLVYNGLSAAASMAASFCGRHCELVLAFCS